MKKVLARVATFILGIMMITVLAVPVLAEESQIQPRWEALSTFQCTMDNVSNLFSNANVSSTASTKSAYSKLTMTLTIQVWNGSAYVDTERSWTSSGTGATSIGKNVMLDPGNYRAKSVVAVSSSSGAYIETITRYSNDIVI